MSEESEVKLAELPPSSESLLVAVPSSSPESSTKASPSSTSTSTTTTPSTGSSPTASATACVVYPEGPSETAVSSAATSTNVTSTNDKPSTSTGLMVTRSAIIHNLRPHKKRSYRFLSRKPRKPRSPKKAKLLQETEKSAQESPKEELKYTPIKPYSKPALPSAIKWRSPSRFLPANDLIFLVCGGRHLSSTVKPESTLQPESTENMDTSKPETSPGTKVSTSPAIITRTSSREPSVPTPTMKTRTSAVAGGNGGGTNPSPPTPSTPTMKTRHSNRVTTPKALGSTTSLTVGGRVMSAPSTPVTPQSQDDSLIKRRSSSRSIKRKKFDDELVESSLVKSSRGGKVPPSPLISQSTPATTTHHLSPPLPKPQPEPQTTPKPQATPPPPPPLAVKEEVVKVEEKKEKAQPKPVEVTKASPPPPPPPKKPEVHVSKKPKIEPTVTPKPTKPSSSSTRHSKVETTRPAPEKKKGKAIPSKSSSSKSSRSKKSKSIVPLARETSRWTAEDDLALITAIHQTNDLEQVFQGVKFSHRFSMKDIEERWYALLYDPIASKASQTAMRLLHPDIKIAIMSQALYSEEEEKVLGTINSSSQPTVDTFQDLINKNSTVFNPMRTPKGLHTHWLTMKQYHLLPDQTVQPMPRGDHVLNFSDAEDMMDDSQLQDPRDEILEHELAAFDRRQKRQIRHLENEIPKWQVLVENVTGMTSQEFDSQTLAVLRGRLVRYLMRSKEITIGRSSKDNTIDVDLSLEGPAWKVSRKQGIIKLRNNGEFYLANEGKRAVHIDGKPVLKGQKWKLTNNSVVEIAGLRFIFLVNQDVINTLRTEPSSIK